MQVVVAVVRRCDSYLELPWKAFALGAAVAALAVVFRSQWRPDWVTSETALVNAVTILGAGAACALLAVFVPRFARLFLRRVRGEVEVRQYAQSLFLTRELFETRHRTAVLILVGLFERRVEILADAGLHGRVGDAEWHRLIETMAPHLRRSRPFEAVREALAAVERLLVAKGFEGGGVLNELPDRPIEERGV